MRDSTGLMSRTYEEFHLGNLLVNLLHELDDKVDKLVLQHLLGVEIGDEEGDVVALNGFAAEDEEGLGALGQETGEFMNEDTLDLVGLLDADADTDAVDAGLDENTLVLVPGDGQGIQQNLGGGLSFNLGYIMTLGGLGGEIGQT